VATDTGGRQMLWLRELDEENAHVLPGTEGARNPFWDPTSEHIGFFSRQSLERIPASGGPAQTVCKVNLSIWAGGTWSRDGVILFNQTQSPILRVRADGGTPQPLTKPNQSAGEEHLGPSFLPDGHHFLYKSLNRGTGEAGIYVASIEQPTEARKILEADPNAIRAIYAETGFLLFLRGRSLYARRFDPDTLAIGEDQHLVASSILTSFEYLSVSVAENGMLALLDRERSGLKRLAWRRRDGTIEGQVGPDSKFFTFAISGVGGAWWPRTLQFQWAFASTRSGASPDGRSVAFVRGARLIVKSLDAAKSQSRRWALRTIIPP
jgi:hypothetical protein